jgi:hypothetical protein
VAGVESLLTLEEKELLTKTARLLEEVIETMEVSNDKELAEDLQAALAEVKEGKVRPLGDLIRELGLEDQVQT